MNTLDPAAYALPAEVKRDLLSPALVIYLAQVRHNIRVVIERAGGVERWRPHVKTTKFGAIYAELVAAGVRHFKCATTREAVVLGRTLELAQVKGASVLAAYPMAEPSLRRLGAIAERFPDTSFSVLCEDPDTCPTELGVFIDLNPGMNRTGVPMQDEERIHAIARAAGPRFCGLHFYEGHLHDPDQDLRRAHVHAGYDEVRELCRRLATADLAVQEVITAGTPAFLAALEYGNSEAGGFNGPVHRVSPGTVVFHDLRSMEENPSLELRPAALVFTRVVSHPTPERFTCAAGSKSVAAEAGHPCAAILGRPEFVAQTPNEEHMPFACQGQLPPRGTEFLLIPRHVCPTVNLAERALLVEEDGTTRAAQVSARAHDLFVDDPLPR